MFNFFLPNLTSWKDKITMYVGPWQEFKLMRALAELKAENNRLRMAAQERHDDEDILNSVRTRGSTETDGRQRYLEFSGRGSSRASNATIQSAPSASTSKTSTNYATMAQVSSLLGGTTTVRKPRSESIPSRRCKQQLGKLPQIDPQKSHREKLRDLYSDEMDKSTNEDQEKLSKREVSPQRSVKEVTEKSKGIVSNKPMSRELKSQRAQRSLLTSSVIRDLRHVAKPFDVAVPLSPPTLETPVNDSYRTLSSTLHYDGVHLQGLRSSPTHASRGPVNNIYGELIPQSQQSPQKGGRVRSPLSNRSSRKDPLGGTIGSVDMHDVTDLLNWAEGLPATGLVTSLSPSKGRKYF